MCSRYSLTSPHEAVRSYFGYRNEATFPQRYNIAPTQPVAIVGIDPRGGLELRLVRWGLLPPWVKDPARFTLLINARAETLAEKPSFHGAFRHKRCLVPADGFYEWIGDRGRKRPFLIRPRRGGPMAFAGLAESWLGADGSELDTMAIVTVAANGTLAPIHQRMPAILAANQMEAWLDVRGTSAEAAEKLLAPAPDDLLEAFEVDARVNSVRSEGPELQQPVRTMLL